MQVARPDNKGDYGYCGTHTCRGHGKPARQAAMQQGNFSPAMDGNGKLHVASENLIRYYRKAGIKEVYFIIHKGKWDIPEYYGDGSDMDVNIGYLIIEL